MVSGLLWKMMVENTRANRLDPQTRGQPLQRPTVRIRGKNVT